MVGSLIVSGNPTCCTIDGPIFALAGGAPITEMK